MKRWSLCILLCVCFLFNACSQQQSAEPGKVYPHIPLSTDSSLSYALYLPKNHTPSVAFIFFDPHGSGVLPVETYQHLADAYGIILIGNNNSSNGTDFNLISTHFVALLNEIKRQYHLKENDVALWGFSGGAKAALYNAGLNNNIHYCVYGGSVMNLQNSTSDLLGFNGKQDMNYTDLISFAAQQQNNPHHFQITFNGKHAWPDTTTAKDAFRWLLLKKMQQKEMPLDKALIQQTFKTEQQQITKLKQQHAYTDAFLACNKGIHFLQSLTSVSFFQQEKTQLAALPAFQQQVSAWQANFDKETQLKAQYQANFLQKDTLYWKKEIAGLWAKAAVDKSGIYDRLLGFLSLAGYSYANHAFEANDLPALEHILFIYQQADPTNPEQAFMRAKLYALKNEPEQTKTAVQEAVKLGIDPNRISQEPLLKGK